MSSQDNTPDSPRHDPVAMEQRKVKFRDIQIDPAVNSYRDADELTEESIAALAEDMLAHGLISPWLVQELTAGRYMGHDCNRRYTAFAFNVKRGAAGFTLDTEIPVQVLPAGTSELAVVKRAVASNVQRQALSDTGKVRATVRMKALGATNVEIGQVLAVSVTTVGRYITLGTNPVWMSYASNHDISYSTAVRLLQVAEAQQRVKDLTEVFDQWREDTRSAIEAEDNRRRAADETLLTIAQKYLQTYLKSEQVDAWIEQLRSGRPLGPPAFRYRAQIRAGDGPRRLEIERISKDLDALSLEDLGKIAGRIADLNADLRKALLEKHAAQQQVQADRAGEEEERPSQALFREIGLFLDGEETADAKEAAMAAEAVERRDVAVEQLTQDALEASEADGAETDLAALVAAPPAAVKTVSTALAATPPATGTKRKP